MKKLFTLGLITLLGTSAFAQKPYTSNAQLIPNYTVATLPPSTYTGNIVLVTDGNGNSCSSGSGSNIVFCRWSGSAWVAIAGNGSGGGATSVTGTTNQLLCSPTTGDVICSITSPVIFPGVAKLQVGSATAPSLSFTGITDAGIYAPGGISQLGLVTGGVAKLFISGSTIRMPNSTAFSWSDGNAVSGSTDTSLTRASAGVVSVNTGSSASQGGLLLGNLTSASTVTATTNSPTWTISGAYQNSATPTYAADTYTLQDVCSVGLNGACVLTILHSGTSGANRVSFLGGPFINASSFVAPTSGSYTWNGRSQFQSPADGVIELINAAASDFNRLQLGGTTSSFPALSRTSAGLRARLADDSADTTFEASHYNTESNCDTTSGTSSPAACGSASSGIVKAAASATTFVINTTTITTNSRIWVTYDTSTTNCTSAPSNIASLLQPYVSARTAGTSFTVTFPIAPLTNGVCIMFGFLN